ncbi:MAG: helix-turn-helix transcriptional regulator [Clostridiales bacterium]|nr:helix-turn-helix transcriptional regulator [Clostridiales bacterium]
MNKFQERLQELLEDKHLSRLQLANNLNISSTTINGYFNKDYYPRIDIAIEISKYFNCSLDYLFGFSDDEKDISLNDNTFIDNFTTLVRSKKMSISKTMRELKMSEYNYYRWMNGQLPKTNNLISIVEYFDSSIDWLLGNLIK